MAVVPSASTACSGELKVFASCVGLGDGVVALEEKMRNASLVLGAARGIEIKNEALVESLPELQHLVNDAEEVFDEIDYFRIKAELDDDLDMLDENAIDNCMIDVDDEMLDETDDCMCDDEINGSSDYSFVFFGKPAVVILTLLIFLILQMGLSMEAAIYWSLRMDILLSMPHKRLSLIGINYCLESVKSIGRWVNSLMT
jgi:hypothetical protein